MRALLTQLALRNSQFSELLPRNCCDFPFQPPALAAAACRYNARLTCKRDCAPTHTGTCAGRAHTYSYACGEVYLSWIVSWRATSPHMAHNLCHLSVAHPFPLRQRLHPHTRNASPSHSLVLANRWRSQQLVAPTPIASHIILAFIFFNFHSSVD